MAAVETVSDDRVEWAREVLAMLAGLPTHQGHALRLLYFEQLTEREVAARMGVALSYSLTAAAEGLRNLGQAMSRVPVAIRPRV